MAMCGGCEPDVRECGEDFPPCVLYNVQLTLWGACSVTCGQGVVSRRVVCIASPGGEVPLSRCGNVEMTQLGSLSRPCAMCPVSTTQDPTLTLQSPSPTQGRDTRADAVTYSFMPDAVTYSFMPGPCSVTCGSGTTQTVSAQCVSSTNVVVDRSLCAGQSLQPQPCSMQPCAVDICAGRYVLFSHRASAPRDPCVLSRPNALWFNIFPSLRFGVASNVAVAALVRSLMGEDQDVVTGATYGNSLMFGEQTRGRC